MLVSWCGSEWGCLPGAGWGELGVLNKRAGIVPKDTMVKFKSHHYLPPKHPPKHMLVFSVLLFLSPRPVCPQQPV